MTAKGIEKEVELIARRLIEVNTFLKKLYPRLVILMTLHKDDLTKMNFDVDEWLKELEAYTFPERRTTANV